MQRFETKYDLLNAAYKDKELKKGTILLLQYLVHKANKEQCFPSVDTIAKALNVCRRTVQYNMRKLECAGYIIRKDRWYNHQQLTNQYVFNLGVTEDKSGKIRYTETEKKKINQVLFNIPECQDTGLCEDILEKDDHQGNIHKAQEILKIYNMPLSGREKLLLVYLYHRANKQGIAYDIPAVFMEAIGVGERTLKLLLRKLRSKNLIQMKHMQLSGRRILVIRLTGKIWNKTEQTGVYGMNVQKRVSDQQQKGRNNIHIQQKENRSFWNKLFLKCKNAIQSALEKIRIILRI